MFSTNCRFPVLQGYSSEQQEVILEKARYQAFRRESNNTKIVLTVISVAVLALLLKFVSDLILYRVFGFMVGSITVPVIFVVAAFVIDNRYKSILLPEIVDQIARKSET